MPNYDFFTQCGLFVIKDFLDAEFCSDYLTQARATTVAPVLILQRNATNGINAVSDETQRKTEQFKVPATTEKLIEKRLMAIKPMLEHHFNLALTGCQKPLFYLYKEGSFFGIHQDCINETDETAESRYSGVPPRQRTFQEDAPKFAKQRRVSIILFMNSRAEEPRAESYCGGALTLYGLIDDARWKPYGFPFMGEPGTLLAFRSDLFHEVKPVTWGERYTIVSWFF